VGAERKAQDPAMLRERLRIGIGAQRVQQLRRALHIGEQKGDGSGREIAPHSVNDALEAALE
jgi:hypothetical protein